MIKHYILVGFVVAVASSAPDRSPPSLSNHDFLRRCWGAVAAQGNRSEFELSFEAILIPGTEGRTVARSRACPDARLGFGALPPEVAARFRRIARSVKMPMLGAGLRGRARVVPLERRTDYFLSVGVTSMHELQEMSVRETQAFIDRNHIG